MEANILIIVAILMSSSLANSSHLKIPYHPHPTDCSKYVLRDWETEFAFDCPTGFHWNDGKKTCDYPWRAGCNTQLQATVVQTAYYIECPDVVDVANPLYLTHADNSKFYMCSGSELLEFRCGHGCYINIFAMRCECLQEIHIVLPLPNASTKVYTRTPTAKPGECSTVVDPKNPVFYAHTNCAMFYVCTSKGLVEMRCNDGFHWNAARNRCERPWDAGCVNFGSTSTETTLSPVTTTSSNNGGEITVKTTEEPDVYDDLTNTDSSVDGEA